MGAVQREEMAVRSRRAHGHAGPRGTLFTGNPHLLFTSNLHLLFASSPRRHLRVAVNPRLIFLGKGVYTLCPMHYALCIMPYALCPMPYAPCPMSDLAREGDLARSQCEEQRAQVVAAEAEAGRLKDDLEACATTWPGPLHEMGASC